MTDLTALGQAANQAVRKSGDMRKAVTASQDCTCRSGEGCTSCPQGHSCLTCGADLTIHCSSCGANQ